MKRCPKCRRHYFDDSLSYCLDDGASMLEGPPSSNTDEPQTAILNTMDSVGDGPTRARLHATDEPTVSSSEISELPRPRIDRRLIVMPIIMIFVVLAGVLGYRYLTSSSKQI